MKCSLRFLEEKDLELVLKWRNSDRVRKNMLNDKIITLEEHKNWFRKISKRDTDYYFMFLIDDIPIGLVCFYDIDYQNKTCFWGAYTGDSSASKGSGTAMSYLGIKYVFDALKIRKISSERLATS